MRLARARLRLLAIGMRCSATARANRDLVVNFLREFPRIRFEVPTGAFYMFFKIEGMTDSAATARRLIDEAGVGFAPGSAFGADGEGFMRSSPVAGSVEPLWPVAKNQSSQMICCSFIAALHIFFA